MMNLNFNKRLKSVSLSILLILSIALFIGCDEGKGNEDASKLPDCKVVEVIDGDTIKVDLGVNNQAETVRLIGVDTPESKHRDTSRNTEEGKIAGKYLQGRLAGETVTLEFGEEQYDKYDRLLAYVYLGKEEINKTLLKEGYARVMIVSPNDKKEYEYKELEQKAKIEKIGFWKNPSCWK